ncbi:hypothetical protein LZM58_30315, partial [Pseudomonas aeruginosa]|nr:hypothetical protein [Pseudomonas aeruginosa]
AEFVIGHGATPYRNGRVLHSVFAAAHGWCHAVNFQVGSMHFPVIQRIITVDFSQAISMFTRRRFSLRSKLFPPPLRSPVRRRVPTAACALSLQVGAAPMLFGESVLRQVNNSNHGFA